MLLNYKMKGMVKQMGLKDKIGQLGLKDKLSQLPSKIGATLATKYGEVIDGKHNGTTVALGNDPKKSVGLETSYSQIIFLDGSTEKGRYNIGNDVVALRINSYCYDSISVTVDYSDSESSVIELRALEDETEKTLFKKESGAGAFSSNGSKSIAKVYSQPDPAAKKFDKGTGKMLIYCMPDGSLFLENINGGFLKKYKDGHYESVPEKKYRHVMAFLDCFNKYTDNESRAKLADFRKEFMPKDE